MTIFTTAPDFVGHRGTIQRNAIQSWKLLDPNRILLIGPSLGAEEIAAEMSLEYIPDVPCAPTGPPLADSFFGAADERGGDLMLYVASDVILTRDLTQAIAQIPFERYLLTGRRRNLDVRTELDFTPGWEQSMVRAARSRGHRAHPAAVDYLLFTHGIWRDIPPFAMGRRAWDNYMVYRAMEAGLPVIDASRVVCAVHQNHDRSFLPEIQWTRYGPEDLMNLELLPTAGHAADSRDAGWILTRDGVRKARGAGLRRRARSLLRSKAPAATRVLRRIANRVTGYE